MDTLIRNIDAPTYRAARARAALEDRSVGELVTAALRDYLARNAGEENTAHLLDQPVGQPAPDQQNSSRGSDHTGTRVDEVVFLYCI